MKRWILALSLVATGTTLAAERWYDGDLVRKGEKLFASNCASCHGDKGEGKVADWKKALPNGTYPPPPVNGTGHAWHHSIDILKRQIRLGGKLLGGAVPAFGDKLSDADMDAVIAYFQSQWPEHVYKAWAERNAPPKKQHAALPSIQGNAASGRDPLRYLRRLAGTRPLGKPAASPVKGILQVELDSNTVYVSDDGRYAFVGNLLDLEAGRNLTADSQKLISRKLLDAFGSDNKVIFKARGKEKAAIDVLTDTSCPYCRKLHNEVVPKLTEAGVTVRCIPYPRGGSKGPGYQGLRRVWCADDPVMAMDQEKHNEDSGSNPNCPRAGLVDKGYALGGKLGIQGTPTIYLPDGTKIGGCVPADKLLGRLN